MGWSEQDEQLAQEIQARVDKETSELKKHVAALTKERDQAIYRMQRVETEELPAAQAREAKLREALENCYGLTGPLDVSMIEAVLAIPRGGDTSLQERIRAAQVSLRDENRRLVSALQGCLASLQGYRRELNDDQPCDAEKMAASLLVYLDAHDTDPPDVGNR